MKLTKYLTIALTLFTTNIASGNEFKKCTDADNFPELENSLCTTVKTSLDHQKHSKDEIDLFIRKFPSLEKQNGSLWLISGGPGESGASFYSSIQTFRETFPNFDIYVPDHRGTGASSSICPGEDIGSLAGKTLVGNEWGECFAHMYSNVEYVQAFSITNAAKDLRFLIQNLSSPGKQYLYGVSYGTQLVLRTSQLEGLHLDGIILDSLVPLQNDEDFELSKRSHVVNRVGNAFLDQCNHPDKCSGLSRDKLKAKLANLIADSNQLKDFSETLPNVRLSDALGGMLDVPHVRNQIPEIINGLSAGAPSKLEAAIQQVNDFYMGLDSGYANFGSSIPLVQIITSSENNLRPKITKEEIKAEEKSLLFTSPLPKLMSENSMPTYSKDGFFAQLPDSLPKTMIFHGTLDPKTHHTGAQRHAKELSKRGSVSFIDVVDGTHFVALNAPQCFAEYAKSFLGTTNAQNKKCLDKNVLLKI
ncbi:alpha/beta fold hydrolase [Parendozoicomonas haliclonae]|uniref:Carboxylesterase A n=1 Tax=Parendozoicomonas haliclonae TaxID=1960125 RepID=A0A1X7AU44_9GAMM|nr:alpha/beta fold hydrolase [Parendozoicomonas haliclonae]SMA50947.1 Carboxylesterase A precursor [Parendozoicomonas haliclonae]